MAKKKMEVSSLVGKDEKSEKTSESMKFLIDSYKAEKAAARKPLLWARLRDRNDQERVALLYVYSLNSIAGSKSYILDGMIIDGESKANRDLFIAYNDLLPSNASNSTYLLEAYEVLPWTKDREALLKKAWDCKAAKRFFAAEYQFACDNWPHLWGFDKQEDEDE